MERGQRRTVEDVTAISPVSHGIDNDVTKREEVMLESVPKATINEANKKEDAKLRLKLDLMILPLIATVYFLASMDRNDIGNAKVAGMQADLGISDDNWTYIAAFFYLGYIVFQFVGTLGLRLFTPPIILSFALVSWGMLTCCQVAVKTLAESVVLRVLIGACEALLQAAPLYLSLFYTKSEIGLRIGFFLSTSSLAGSFNGLIAYGLQIDLADNRIFAPWQWLFLIEGVIPILVGLLLLVFLPPVPERAKRFFSVRERELIVERTIAASNVPDSKFNLKQVLVVFTEPQVYFLTALYCGVLWSTNSFGQFLPSIITGFGWSSTKAQLMTVPVYAISFVVALAAGYLSDRLQMRGPIIIFVTIFSFIGYIMLIAIPTSTGARFAACCLIAIGVNANIVLGITWINVTTVGYNRRAVSLATVNGCAQVMSIVSILLYNDPPRYLKGNISAAVLMAWVIGVTTLFDLWILHANRRKRRNQYTEKAQQMRLHSIEEIGAQHPDFFYCL